MAERPALNKPVMPDSLRKFVEEAPGGKGAVEDAEPPAKGVTIDYDAVRARMPTAAPTKAVNMRIPLDLYEDLMFLRRMTDTNMTEIFVESARVEVKKRLAAFNKG